jgi:hypothetical protein
MTKAGWKRGTAIVAAALLLGAAGCGDDDDDDTAARCDARDQLSSSVQDLEDVDVVDDGTDALRTAFDAVVDDVGQLADAVGDDLQDDVDAVEGEIDDIRTTIGSIGDQSVAGVAETLRDELGELSDATSTLVDEAGQDC